MKTLRHGVSITLCSMLVALPAARAVQKDESGADRAILQQAANAMIFQAVFADVALALSRDPGVLELAQHIHDLSSEGLHGIETMALECGAQIEAELDPTAWRRVLAVREITTSELRDQAYLDAQLLRLYEARQENLDALVRARHALVQGFARRSEPEIEALILLVRDVVRNFPTHNHPQPDPDA